MVVLFLVFWGTSILFSTVVYQFTFLPAVFKCSLFSRTPTFVIYDLFDNSHSDRCGVISHCGFDLLFLWWLMMLSIFSYTVGHLHIFFGKMSIQASCPFYFFSFFFFPALFKKLIYFFDVELYKLFIYFGYDSLMSHIICKCFLPFSILFY